MDSFCVWEFIGALTPHARIQLQTVYYQAILQVRTHNLIDIARVHIGVPNAFGIHDGNRSARTPVQTSCFIDPHPARAIQIGFAYCTFAVVKGFLRTVLGARRLTTFSLVQAKENVAFKVRGGLGRRRWRNGCGHGAL
jgi:hypothetical protein